MRLVLIAALAGLGLPACSNDRGADRSSDLAPVEITDQEGAVCGMLVRDQSAPRAQVVHRDGERSFVCSIGDLMAYLEAPSPHGAPSTVLVEVMEPDEDPAASHPGAHAWVPAEEGVYVVGIERQQIMGAPVLVYRDRASAERVIAGSAAQALEYGELRRWWRAQQNTDPHERTDDISASQP